jgi:hypothetical protein
MRGFAVYLVYLTLADHSFGLRFPANAALPPDLTRVSEIDRRALEESQKQVVSFLDQTIRSMQNTQTAVEQSNEALDQEVTQSKKRLDDLTRSFLKKNDRPTTPYSLIQTKSESVSPVDNLDGDDGENSFDQVLSVSDHAIFRKPRGSVSILELAKARAAASEKKYQAAIKRLEEDKEWLLKDESMRRARAAQERRHMTLQK